MIRDFKKNSYYSQGTKNPFLSPLPKAISSRICYISKQRLWDSSTLSKKNPKHLGLLLHNIICYLASLPNFKVTIKVMVKFSTGTTHFINLTGTVLRDYVNLTTICKTQILSCDSQGTNKKQTFPLAKSKKKPSSNSPTLQEHSLYFSNSQLSFW